MSDPVSTAAINNADSDLKRIANFARGIIALEAEVARFGSMTQAMSETQRCIDQANTEKVAAVADYVRRKANLDASFAQLADDAKAKHAATLFADAQEITDTRARSEDRARREQAQADATLATTQTELDAARADLAKVQALITATREELKGIKSELAAVTAAHDSVKAAHAEFLAGASKLHQKTS